MLQRCMSILMESKEVWPLASRWLEALEKFSRDPKATAVSLEGSMADGVSFPAPFLCLFFFTLFPGLFARYLNGKR